jgi:RHS repeat-associated protein
VYDGDGQRVKGTVSGVTTTYIGNWFEWSGSTSTMKKYYYSGATRVAMRTGSSTLNYLLSDHLGSTAITANSGGGLSAELRYRPWGETRYTWGSTPTTLRYTGQREQAELGLYFYGARWYDGALGRFIQVDTVVPGAGDSQAWDRYAYALNNPLRYNDPTGHCIGPLAIVCVALINAAPAIIEAVGYAVTAYIIADQIANNPTIINGEQVNIGIIVPPSPAFIPNLPTVTRPLALPDPKIINPRSGEIVSTVLEEDITVYRVWGGQTEQSGRWFTTQLPLDQESARQGLSLPPENSAEFVTPATIPAGTRIQTSTAKGILGQPGGWKQIELLKYIPIKFGRTIPLPPRFSGIEKK